MIAHSPINSVQQRILEAVANWKGPDVPNARNLAPVTGFANESGVRWNFKQLKEKGFLELRAYAGRKCVVPELTPAAIEFLNLPSAPRADALVMAPAPSGKPLIAYQISCGPLVATTAPPVILNNPRDFFRCWDDDRDYALIAQGDSMHDPDDPGNSISDGDIVHARRDILPANGELVHAEFQRPDGEHDGSLKVFELHGSTVTLRPLNPCYETIVLPGENVHIKGVVMEWVALRQARRHYRK